MSTSGGRCDNCGRSHCVCAPGSDGVDGIDGEPGPPGQKGETGAQGSTGERGAQGAPGLDGADGEDGESIAGPRGETGQTGATGQAGPQGVPGAPGLDGEDGASIVGPKGDTGATGPQGPQGPQGTAGAAGSQGVPGAAGSDGDDGEPGPPGAGFGPIRNGRIMGTDTVTSGFPRPLTGAEVLADLSAQAAGAFNWNAKELTNIATPGSGNSAATRDYVDIAPGRILATTTYAPGSIAAYTVASTTITALDTTNLTITFIVPASGLVDIEITHYAITLQTVNVCELWVALLNHAGGTRVGNPVVIQQTAADALRTTEIVTAKWHLTGLTPGSLTLDYAAGRTNATGCQAFIYAGGGTSLTVATLNGTAGPLTMKAIVSI